MAGGSAGGSADGGFADGGCPNVCACGSCTDGGPDVCTGGCAGGSTGCAGGCAGVSTGGCSVDGSAGGCTCMLYLLARFRANSLTSSLVVRS